VSAGGQAVAVGGLRVTGRAILLAVVVLLLALAGVGVFRQYLAQRSEIDRMERRIDGLEAHRIHLQGRIERLQDPEYLERLARECLGMVRPGEISFVVPDEQGPARC
jgi:cell division protein FtsB